MHVVDEKGEKMSKSKGNTIDPLEVIDEFSVEGFRIWTCLEGDITRGDIKCSFKRIEGHSKFLTKLWNIARFISMFPIVNTEVELENTDTWILSELSKLIQDVKKSYEEYAFNDVINSIRDFTWNYFASHYIEMVKSRAYCEKCSNNRQASVWFTLHECMQSLLLLLAPIIPFFTEHIWQILYGKESIHLKEYPKVKWNQKLNKYTQKILEFNSYVWNKKKEEGISLNNPIKLEIPEDLMIFYDDLRSMHNIVI